PLLCHKATKELLCLYHPVDDHITQYDKQLENNNSEDEPGLDFQTKLLTPAGFTGNFFLQMPVEHLDQVSDFLFIIELLKTFESIMFEFACRKFPFHFVLL